MKIMKIIFEEITTWYFQACLGALASEARMFIFTRH
jgi:hypothetical protein